MRSQGPELKIKKPILSIQRRALFLKVIGYDQKAIPICFMLQQQAPKHLDEMLKWLIRNQITGTKFTAFYNFEMDASPLKLMATLNGKIERSNIRPLSVVRDF